MFSPELHYIGFSGLLHEEERGYVDIFCNFIDFIDSEVNLEFGNIYNNQIEMKLNINDELIKLEYKGLLNIK